MSESRWAFMSRKVIGSPDNPMLIRWRIIQTPWGGIYLHFIHREDLDRLPHDHPWWFRSLVLRGAYAEEYYPDSRNVGNQRIGEQVLHRTWKRGQRHTFPVGAAHRITKTYGKVTTLVLVGPKYRTWGFYDGRGFIDWRDYHGQTNGWNKEQELERMGRVQRTQMRTAEELADALRKSIDEELAGRPVMVPGKSWDEFNRLTREAMAAGKPRPNVYHYFADRWRNDGFTPPPSGISGISEESKDEELRRTDSVKWSERRAKIAKSRNPGHLVPSPKPVYDETHRYDTIVGYAGNSAAPGEMVEVHIVNEDALRAYISAQDLSHLSIVKDD